MDKCSRKRSSTTEGKGHQRIKCVIAEFEGVLIQPCFIKDKVHGYVSEHAETFLNENFDKDEVKNFIEGLKKEKVENLQAIPEDGKKEDVIKAVVEHVKALLGKSDTCCKVDALVFAIFKSASDKNELKIELFEEVGKCLKAWVDSGLKVVVLTSKCKRLVQSILLGGCDGLNEADISVESLGDDPSSVKETYAALAAKCQVNAADIIFVTQCPNEAVAASAAGLEAKLVKRVGCGKDVKKVECGKGVEKVECGREVKKGQEKGEKQQECGHPFITVHCLSEVLKTEAVPCKQPRHSDQPPSAPADAVDAK